MNNSEIEALPFGGWPLPDGYLIEIGRVTVLWSSLEGFLNLCLGKLAGFNEHADPKPFILVTHSSFPQRLDMLGALCEHLVPGFPKLVSRITAIDGVAVTLFDGFPASASRRAVGIVGSGSGSSDAPSLIERGAGRSGHQGPVLAVLAMLAAKRRLRVAPRGCALPLTAAATGAQ